VFIEKSNKIMEIFSMTFLGFVCDFITLIQIPCIRNKTFNGSSLIGSGCFSLFTGAGASKFIRFFGGCAASGSGELSSLQTAIGFLDVVRRLGGIFLCKTSKFAI
jgi:hypothetical protein